MPKYPPECNLRIDELATPNRRAILALYQYHAHHLERTKVENLQQLLQELYPMTPEQAAQYFQQLEQAALTASQRRKTRLKQRKLKFNTECARKRDLIYKKFAVVLQRFFTAALKQQIPPLLPERLRFLADTILVELCRFVDAPVPDRMHMDQECADAKALIRIADWIAVNVNYLYYAIRQEDTTEDCANFKDD